MLQRCTLQILHGDERLPVLFANVINRANVGVIQRGRRLRFTLEAAQGLRIAGNLIGQELQCDKTVQPRIFRLEDDAHTAAPEFLDDAVVRDGLSDH